MYIHRFAENNLIKFLKSGKVLIILGARQVGKTTLINHLLKGKKTTLLNLDIEVDKARFIASSALSAVDAAAK